MYDDYLLLKITTKREKAETVETALLELGALSCTLQDAVDTPIHEPAPGQAPLWPDVEITGMFPDTADSTLLSHLMERQLAGGDISAMSSKKLQGQEWERVWMDDFAPLQISDNLWVVPSFCEAPDPQAVNLMIDPGLAFGSGTHATTTLCLRWLAKQDLSGKVVLDYGCGSGILAVAAACMGAAKVYTYDIDPQALTATVENAERNNVVEQIVVCKKDTEVIGKVDLLVANILLRPLLDLTGRFAQLLGDDGRLGLSGVLSEQVELLANAYSGEFQHCETSMLDQWVLYSAKKQGKILPA